LGTPSRWIARTKFYHGRVLILLLREGEVQAEVERRYPMELLLIIIIVLILFGGLSFSRR
jgi:hypothetical protein